MNGNVPSFLIVGAMKAGTTTLYYDLSAHPDLHMPERKEPNILVENDTNDEILKAYARHFSGAAPGQLCGEASTAYTKRPEYEGVAERALETLGPNLKILYIERDPVSRAVSHFKHDRQHGEVDGDFANAVMEHPRFINYGRYEWQIAPWKECFGDQNVKVVKLDTYSADRRNQLDEVLSFIGVEPERLGALDLDAKANSAIEQKTIKNPFLRAFVFSDFYQNEVKGRLSRNVRERIRRAVLPPPKDEAIEVPADVRSYIEAQASAKAGRAINGPSTHARD